MPPQTATEQSGKQLKETQKIRQLFAMAFVLNLVLAAVKTALALLSGSLAVTAGAIDSVTDSVASLAVFGGILLSTRTTQNFPLGLYKIENLLSVVIALFIFLTGYEVARRVFTASSEPPEISLPTVLLLLAGTVAIFVFGRYALALGRQTGSPTLKAEGKHRQADVLANGVVLLAIGLHYLGLQQPVLGLTVDRWAAVLVLLFVAHTGWELLSDGMRVLLDASIDHDTLDRIRETITKEPMVMQISSLIGRNAGRFRFIQANLVMRTRDLKKAHATSHRIEQEIMREIPNVQRVVIHYEPYVPQQVRVAVPLEDGKERLSEHFGGAPYFALITHDVAKQETGGSEILANPFQELERGKGIRVAEWLLEQQIDRVVVRGSMEHKGPEYVFNNAGVEILNTEATTLDTINLTQLKS